MATAQTRIDRAMRLIGALESGESPTAQETADCLVALNGLIDSWRNDSLMVYAVTSVTKTLTANDGSYTIGSGADINTTRPVKIEGGYITINGTDYPVEVITEESYRNIQDKATTGQPDYVYYDPQMANGVIYLYPVPDSAYALTLKVWTPISTIAAASDSIVLPPGYERAIDTNLAIEIAPEFQKTVSAELASAARNSLKLIKQNNVQPFYSQIEFADRGAFDIYAGV